MAPISCSVNPRSRIGRYLLVTGKVGAEDPELGSSRHMGLLTGQFGQLGTSVRIRLNDGNHLQKLELEALRADSRMANLLL